MLSLSELLKIYLQYDIVAVCYRQRQQSRKITENKMYEPCAYVNIQNGDATLVVPSLAQIVR